MNRYLHFGPLILAANLPEGRAAIELAYLTDVKNAVDVHGRHINIAFAWTDSL